MATEQDYWVGIDSLFDFVAERTSEAGGAATAAGDEAGRRFQDGTLAIITDMRHDLDSDPRRADEVVRYLYRMAARHADHPEFQPFWLLFDPA